MSIEMEKLIISDHEACAITSMVKGPDGKLYIGLTSESHVLYEYDTLTGEFSDLGPIFPLRTGTNRILDKIHNSLQIDNDTLYIGQGLNIDWTNSPYDFDMRSYGGGHLFSYHIPTGELDDLGVAVPFNAIHGMGLDPAGRFLFGYTIPDNHFFKFDLESRTATDFGKISAYACHNYVADGRGNAYGAWKKDFPYNEEERLSGRFVTKGTYLLKYDGESDSLMRTENLIVYGDEHDIFGNIGVDTWLRTSKGEIYGGTAITGSVFKVNPDDTVRYVGNPTGSPRLTAMVEGPDGLIYGCGGFPYMHVFSLDPVTDEMRDFGPISTEGEYCYAHCMVFGDDGYLYAGETDGGKACLYKIAI